ncbi:MAG: lema family protein [Comamonadaceae bacterium]|nr:MAG: lema family protein [Comamonadaceae bacterium]
MDDLSDSLLLRWIALAVLVFWFVGAHNRLVRMRAAALLAFSVLDAALTRQIDFVLAASVPPSSTAESVDGLPSSSAEAELKAAIHASAEQLMAVLGATRPRALEPEASAALSSALHAMIGAWHRLHPEATHRFEADGTLSRPADLLASGERPRPRTELSPPLAWPEPSAAAEIARAQFNLSVARYNAAVRQFPAVLVAWLFRLRPGAAVG